MKCDDFLGNLRTGGLWKRAGARLHAARCRRCAASERLLCELERELAETEPLSLHVRRLWEQAAKLEVERPASVRAHLAVFATAGAILLVAATAIHLYWSGNRSNESANLPPGVQTAQEETSLEEESLAQVSKIEHDLRALLADLDRLSSKATLLDEGRQINELLQQHGEP